MSESRRRTLPWFPILVALLAVGSLVWVGQRAELERNLKGWITTAIPLLAGILLILWFLITSRFSGKTRLKGLAVFIVAIVASKLLLKVDGVVDGRGLPRLAWRWSSSSQPALAAPLPQAESPSASKTASTDALSRPAMPRNWRKPFWISRKTNQCAHGWLRLRARCPNRATR